jgi:hypothetical protein
MISTASSGVSGGVVIDGVQFEQSGTASEWKEKRVMFDAIGTQEVLNNNFAATTTLINANFTKTSKDKILRIQFTYAATSATNNISFNIGGGIITYTYNSVSSGGAANDVNTPSYFVEFFDITSVPDGSVNVTVTTNQAVTGSIRVLRNRYFFQ